MTVARLLKSLHGYRNFAASRAWYASPLVFHAMESVAGRQDARPIYQAIRP